MTAWRPKPLSPEERRSGLVAYAVVLLLVLFFGWMAARDAHGEPLYQTASEGTRIVLHSEPCALGELVTNLPRRATWVEGDKTVEGCFGVDQRLNLVRLYFADRTVVAIPAQYFAPVVRT